MYTTADVVRIVNELLDDIEQHLHSRNAVDVFTNGNCGFMPTLYGDTGMRALPIYAVKDFYYKQDDIIIAKFGHIMSIIDHPLIGTNPALYVLFQTLSEIAPYVYDITCTAEQPNTDLTGWTLKSPPDKDHIVHASQNYMMQNMRDGCYNHEIDRMTHTRSELQQRLSKFGMLDMHYDKERGLYLPNESTRSV